MDDSEKSLQIIDTAVLPGINGWPASAAAEKTRFLEIVVAKRNAILAEITEEQSGSLDGRTYADRSGSTKLEFDDDGRAYFTQAGGQTIVRSEEHTSELQSLMRISYAVFCLKKKKTNNLQKQQ